jgi:hypothetical protein
MFLLAAYQSGKLLQELFAKLLSTIRYTGKRLAVAEGPVPKEAGQSDDPGADGAPCVEHSYCTPFGITAVPAI